MIVVTGATGNVGRALVRTLAAADERVTAVARRSAPDLPGIRHVSADLAEPASLKPAVDGADALFLLTPADLLWSGDGGTVVRDVLDVARAGGVRRVVLLSSQGVGTLRHPSALEDATTQSGLEWTVLRPGGFDTNALLWAETIRTRRTAAAPFGDVALPSVDPADIAEVAAVTLRERGHAGRTYVLTGPAPISPRQQAEAIGAALGESVRFVEHSPDQARAQLSRFMPEPVVLATLGILGSPSAAERQVSPDVARILGRPAGTFAEWARRNAAAFS
jgi:uncharacterized protein YbjT (DUF2867 family)